MKKIIDLIYGVEKVKRKCLQDFPSDVIVAADGCKGIKIPRNQEIEKGSDWIKSRRSVILLTDKKIIFGDWYIPLENIKTAELIKLNSLFGAGQVLKIQTIDQNNYQFGMQFNSKWSDQKVLTLQVKRGKVKLSVFSIIIRVILVLILMHWCYSKFYPAG